MLFTFIEKVLPPKYATQIEKMVNYYKNIVGLIVCVSTLYNIYQYETTKDPGYIDMTNYIIITQNIIELPLVNLSSFVHHVIVLTLMYCKYYVSPYDVTKINKDLLMMEISSIPLIIRTMIHDSRRKSDKVQYYFYELISAMLFTASFYYYRLDYYVENILYDRSFYDQYTDISVKQIAYVFTYTFYFLNIYWFMIILKNWVKYFRSLISTNESTMYIINEWCLQYTSGITWITACIYYNSSMRWVYMYDLFGLFVLSISSYGYHTKIYNALVNAYPSFDIDTAHGSILPFYQLDVTCILMNGFFKTMTNIWRNSSEISFYILPYDLTFTTTRETLTVFFVILYGCGIYQSVTFLQKLQQTGTSFLYSETKFDWKFTKVNIYICLPLVVSILLSIIQSKSYELGIQNFTVLYVIILIRTMHIGYEYNHLLFHMSILWLTITICRLNLLD